MHLHHWTVASPFFSCVLTNILNVETPQAKILRDPERPDAAGHPGGKSRGFGFVEFGDASHALAALRQLNNNPTTFGSKDRCVCCCGAELRYESLHMLLIALAVCVSR
jgi:hypothetical protein